MAVQYIESPIHIPDIAAEPLVDPSRTVSGVGPNGAPEINLGAFRGLAFALIFEAVLVLLGGVAWQIFHVLR
jgi:hypothetical protein